MSIGFANRGSNRAGSARPSPSWILGITCAICLSLIAGRFALVGRAQTPAASTNIAASALGGEIESVTRAYGGPGLRGEALINDAIDDEWQPDEIVDRPDDQNSNDFHLAYPIDIVISFYRHDTALVSAVAIEDTPDSPGPGNVEIWTSTASTPDAFTRVAAKTLAFQGTAAQTISFAPVEARFVKVRIASGPTEDLGDIGMRRIRILEGSRPGYKTLLARHPDLPQWKTSVRRAAQLGIDWLEPNTMDWQLHRKCFGCHVQAQTLMGLAIAQTNSYVIAGDLSPALIKMTAAFQDPDGHERYEGNDEVATPTHFAAMGLAYYDDANGVKTDPLLKRYADWMMTKVAADGSFPQDLGYAPVSQGTINSTANAVAGFMKVFEQTGDARYRAKAEAGLAYIAAATPETMQDRVFQVIALARYGSAAQRDLVARGVKTIKSQQNSDGGWAPSADSTASDAFATGQVLYAFKEAGVNIESPEFNKGVRYLIDTQKTNGAWGGDDQAALFAPTMWAVIGLAGAVEPPMLDALREELNKTGKLVLYINFDFNKATIRPDAAPILSQVVKLLAADPSLQFSVNGYTDNVGTRDYNQKLSESRATAVLAALVAGGIDKSRLDAAGFGQESPIADNTTEKGRAKNRRVELVKK